MSTNKNTLGSYLKHWQTTFQNKGLLGAQESAELIMAKVIGFKKTADLASVQDRILSEEELEQLNSFCSSRLARVPIQYIIKEGPFRDITLKMEPPVFIPTRETTELLVEVVLEKLSELKNPKYKMLEIGCGTGAISLSILHSNPNIESGVAIDINPRACELTSINGKSLKLSDRIKIINAAMGKDGVIKSFDSCDIDFSSAQFDLIVSNPPYTPIDEVFLMEPERSVYQDLRARDGGLDGLDIIKPILKYSTKGLKVGGRMFLETWPGQPESIQDLIKKHYSSQLKFINSQNDRDHLGSVVEIEKVAD